MASDQKRWFKVWTSLLVDMDHLPDEVIGRWVRLGCRTALVGHDGAVTFASQDHLATFLRVPVDAVHGVTMQLPNVRVESTNRCNENASLQVTVTFQNWRKYQVDSSVERVRKFRSRVTTKRRGDKKRTPLPPERSLVSSSEGDQRQPKPPPRGDDHASSGKGPLSGLLRAQLDRTWDAMQRAASPPAEGDPP